MCLPPALLDFEHRGGRILKPFTDSACSIRLVKRGLPGLRIAKPGQIDVTEWETLR